MTGWRLIQEQLLLKHLLWRSRPTRIGKFLKGKRYTNSEPLTSDKVKVAAVQAELRLLTNPLDYAEEMYQQVYAAVDQGAQLVVFPEDNAAHLVGMLPGMANNKDIAGALNDIHPNVKVADIFAYLTPVTESVYYSVFSSLAASFAVYIMAGSMIVNDGGRTVNRACLFGPDGNVVGSQEKLHLLPLEAQWGICAGSSFKVFDTAVGALALPICMDATYFETFRAAAFHGAQTVLIPAANPDRYNFWKELRGVWPRVQESGLFAVRASMVGNVLGMTFTGRSGIFAPLDLTAGKDGVLAQAESAHSSEIVIAELDYAALAKYRQSLNNKNHLNKELCNKYLPRLYDGLSG